MEKRLQRARSVPNDDTVNEQGSVGYIVPQGGGEDVHNVRQPSEQELREKEVQRKIRERQRLIAENEALFAQEVTDSYKVLKGILGEQCMHSIQERMQGFLFQNHIDDVDIPERHAELLSHFVTALQDMRLNDSIAPQRRALLLQAIGVTMLSGAIDAAGLNGLLSRLLGGGDIFPNPRSRDLFENAGGTMVELTINQSLFALQQVFEPHVVDAIYAEIRRQSMSNSYSAMLDEINRTLLIYVEELQTMAMRTPRTRMARVELAYDLGIADDTEMKGIPDLIAISYQVRYARTTGSIFQNKDTKRRVRDEEADQYQGPDNDAHMRDDIQKAA